LGLEAQQKAEQFLSKSRQCDQQWQAKLDAVRADLQSQAKDALRRREAEADVALRELEARLRMEMQERDEAAQVKASQREQELVAQLTEQEEAHQAAAQAQWEQESERTRAALEPIKTMLAHAEQERDAAKQSAAENARQAQNLEKKLTEASSFFNGLRNGQNGSGRIDEKVGSHGR
jgi:hypothetical protein